MDTSYQCEHCKGVFLEPPGREAEALREADALYPDQKEEERVRVCHVCWLKLMEWAEEQGYIGPEWRGYK